MIIRIEKEREKTLNLTHCNEMSAGSVVGKRVALKSLAFIPAVESLLRKGVTKSRPDAFVPDLEDSIANKDKASETDLN